MQALWILKHALLQLIENWRQALTLSVVPMLILIPSTLAFPYVLARRLVPSFFYGQASALLVGASVVGGLAATWLAVNWHRFVLLGERTGFLPRAHPRQVVRYIGTAFLLGLIMVPVMVALLYTLSGFMTISGQTPLHASVKFLQFALTVVLLALSLRVGVALPGAALGRDRPISLAWKAMAGTHGTLLALAALLVLAQAIYDQVFGRLVGVLLAESYWGLVLYVAVYWFWLMFSVAILTALYGHYVERRA